MALQKSLTLSSVPLPDAIIDVTKIKFNYKLNEVTITVAIYYNQTYYNNGNPELVTLDHICEGDAYSTYFSESVLDDLNKTPLTQAIIWLLTLDMYSGAIEV